MVLVKQRAEDETKEDSDNKDGSDEQRDDAEEENIKDGGEPKWKEHYESPRYCEIFGGFDQEVNKVLQFFLNYKVQQRDNKRAMAL